MRTPQGNPQKAWHERPHHHERPDDGNAFLPDPSEGTRRPFAEFAEGDAEASAEEFIDAATQGESVSEDARDEVVDEEEGGPFVMLDEDAHQRDLEPEERSLEKEGHDAVQKLQTLRGARWVARGP